MLSGMVSKAFDYYLWDATCVCICMQAGGRRVLIYGTPEAVQMAQQIIRQKIQEASASASRQW